MRIAFLLVAFICFSTIVFAQPRIVTVLENPSYPFKSVRITGLGFSNNVADLDVWFGNVKVTPTSSTTTTIDVIVPGQARLSNIEVVNRSTKLSGFYISKFMPKFNGVTGFTSNFVTMATEISSDQIFDLCTCDLDGDGKTDIVGTRPLDLQKNLFVLKNNSAIGSSGTASGSTLDFLAPSSIAFDFPIWSIACGDLNGDELPELVATRGGSTGSQVFIFTNTTTGGILSFDKDTLALEANDIAKEVAIRDLNRDGQSDIIVTNGSAVNKSLYTFENNHNTATKNLLKTEFTRFKKTMTGSSGALEVQDFTNDGWPDIVTTAFANGKQVSILPNPANSTANFTTSDEVVSPVITGSNFFNDLASADFDKKNGPDLVITDRGANRTFVALNDGTGMFDNADFIATNFNTLSAWGADVADMNGDGFADFVVSGRNTTTPLLDVFINNGLTPTNFTETTIPVTLGNWFIKVGDYDGDARPDIAVSVTDDGTLPPPTAIYGINVYKNQNCHKPVILQGSSITLCNGQDTVLQVLPMHGVNYTWSTGQNGFSSRTITDADALVNGGVITVTGVGEGTGCTGANVTTTITILQGGGTPPNPQTISGPAAVCEGSALAFTTTTSASPSPSYVWTGPNGFSVTTPTPAVTVTTTATSAQTGNYYLQISSGGCYSNLSPEKPVIVAQAPTSFTITGPTGGICAGSALALNATDDINYTYQWKKGGTAILNETKSFFPKDPRNADVADNGSYTVDITAYTCPTTPVGPFALKVFTAPVATYTPDPIQVCVGTEVTFDGAGSTIDNVDPKPTTIKYDWNFGNATLTDSDLNAPKHTYNTAGPQNTTLVIRYPGAVGCTSLTFPKTITVSNATSPSLSAPVSEICGDGTEIVTLTATPGFVTYTWTPTSASVNTKDVNAPGLYEVETTDINGCIGNADVTLTSKLGCESTVASIPKVFTPNGDTVNDKWVITGEPKLTECQMSVFDGRGRRIYEVKGYPLEGWDGVANGKQVPDGTYYYVLGCPGAKPVTGSVLIVR